MAILQSTARKWLIPGLLAAGTFFSDLFSKIWANSSLHYGQSEVFLPGIMRLTLTRNTGGAFGIGRGNSALITFLACTIVALIIAWILKRERSENPPNGLERAGIGMIVAGAIGNLFDRISHGDVTDFLEFTFIDFPVFNVADALIDVGAFLVILGAAVIHKAQDAAEPVANKESE